MSASVRLSMFVIPALGGFTCAPSLGAQVNTPEEVKLLEVWNTEGKEIADGLTTIHGLAEAEDGRIWISDVWPTQGRVLRLDPETMNAEVVGRTGEGPGEVRLPTYMAVTPDGRMAVYDMARSAVEIYDSDGEPFRRVQLRGAPVPAIKGFAALATGGYVVSGFSPPVASAIHYFDDEGRWVRGWRERYPPRHAFPSGESELTVMMAQTAGTGAQSMPCRMDLSCILRPRLTTSFFSKCRPRREAVGWSASLPACPMYSNRRASRWLRRRPRVARPSPGIGRLGPIP